MGSVQTACCLVNCVFRCGLGSRKLYQWLLSINSSSWCQWSARSASSPLLLCWGAITLFEHCHKGKITTFRQPTSGPRSFRTTAWQRFRADRFVQGNVPTSAPIWWEWLMAPGQQREPLRRLRRQRARTLWGSALSAGFSYIAALNRPESKIEKAD
jgi:hypothetical protein